MPATLTIKDRTAETGGGGRGPVDRRDFGGGGGGGRGDGSPDYRERLRRYRLGMALGLVAIVTLFVTISSAFLLRAHLVTWDEVTGSYARHWHPISLPIMLLVVNTLMLIASSVTVELARRQTAESALLAPLRSIPGITVRPDKPVPWLGISTGLGVAFLGGQGLAWRELARQGLDGYTGASSAFFYILTGTHAVHVFAGLLALAYAGATTSMLSKPVEVQHIVVDVVSWYWHVVTLLWIYLFALLLLSH